MANIITILIIKFDSTTTLPLKLYPLLVEIRAIDILRASSQLNDKILNKTVKIIVIDKYKMNIILIFSIEKKSFDIPFLRNIISTKKLPTNIVHNPPVHCNIACQIKNSGIFILIILVQIPLVVANEIAKKKTSLIFSSGKIIYNSTYCQGK